MRLGVNGELGGGSPEEWIGIIREFGATAVVAPMTKDDSPEVRKDYLRLIEENDLVIGEVGIWRNTLDPDSGRRKEAIAYAAEQIAFADEINAGCCVNIAGAYGEVWDGYYPENYSEDVYALLVDTIRRIIDDVRPKRTFYTLEPMYWMHPDSPDDYLKLLKDIDRKEAAVHMDYVNMINGFEKFHNRNAFLKECFDKLGPYTKSIHAKDIRLTGTPPCCLTEALPGEGSIDFTYMLRLAAKIPGDVPVFVEHLHSMEEYRRAFRVLKDSAAEEGLA